MDLGNLKSIKLQREGSLWVITISRPFQYNALDALAHRELDATFDAFVADPESTVAVLTAEGHHFCAGHDYAAEKNQGVTPLPSGGFGGLTRRFDNPKPIIAAVNGDAYDEGFELVLACDLIVSEEHARFGFAQPTAGRPLTEGGDHRLLRRIPYHRAMDMLLNGAMLSAREGVLMGLVNEIAPRSDVVAIARHRAERISAMPRQAVLATKQAATRGSEMGSVAQAMQGIYPEAQKLLESDTYAASGDRMIALRAARIR